MAHRTQSTYRNQIAVLGDRVSEKNIRPALRDSSTLLPPQKHLILDLKNDIKKIQKVSFDYLEQLKPVKQGNFPTQQKPNLAYKKPPNGIKTKRQLQK